MAGNVRFSKEFYTRQSIDAAIEDWSEVGGFVVEDEESHHVVQLQSLADGDVAGEDGEVALGEFKNYVLGLEVGTRR